MAKTSSQQVETSWIFFSKIVSKQVKKFFMNQLETQEQHIQYGITVLRIWTSGIGMERDHFLVQHDNVLQMFLWARIHGMSSIVHDFIFLA